jgi:putative transposase
VPVKRRGQPPPGYSYSESGSKIPDSVIVEYIREYRTDPFLSVEGGSKILSKYFRRDHGIIINHKKVARLCKVHGLSLSRPKKKQSKFTKMSKNRNVSGPNQVWEFDIKYGYLHGERRFFFLLGFIDVFSREVKGWYLGRHCRSKDVSTTLILALEQARITQDHGLVIRSDNGSQMRASQFQEAIKNLPTDHEFIPIRTPNKNAHIESFFSIYDKHLQRQYFWSFKEAYEWTIEFMDFYNHDRIHGSLGMSPSEFAINTQLHHQEKFMQSI